MRLIITLIILNSFLILGFSQDSTIVDKSFRYRNSIQTEIFGHGLLYSLNYERVFLNKLMFKTTGQIGFSYYPPKGGIIQLWIPVVFNELISFDKHHIEFGFGYIFTKEHVSIKKTESSREWGGFLTGRIGYRYQKPTGRLILRIGFTPFFEYQDFNFEYRNFEEFHPSGGLSIGYTL